MNYEEFKQLVSKQFMEFMPEEYAGYQLEIQQVDKINRSREGIQLIPSEKQKFNISSVIYLDQMYQNYRNCGDWKQVFQEAAESMAEGFQKASNYS